MNLLSLLQDQLGDTLVDQASSFLGENKSNTSSAMSAILPSLMGSLIGKGSNESGAAGLLNMITSGGHDGSMLGNLTGLFSGGDSTNGLLSSGGSILSSLLGNNMGSIVSKIAGFSGISENSSSSLMKMAAPMLLGMLGKQVAGNGLNATGLMNLLSSQKGFVSAAMPSGLSGISSLLGFADGFKDNLSSAGDKIVESGSKVVDAGAKAVETGAKTGGSMLKWLLPLLAILLIGSYFGFKTGCSAVDDTVDAGKGAIDATVDAGKGAVDATIDAGKGAIDATVDAGKDAINALKAVTLPGGKEIKFMAGSFGEKVVTFLSGEESDLSKSYAFDGLTFKTGSADLSDESNTQLDNLSEILKSYTTAEIRIEGHTDNSGNPTANKTLSSKRAAAAKAALVSRGVAANRITSIGYGQEKPVADNATEEGKAANRRVELYFTKK